MGIKERIANVVIVTLFGTISTAHSVPSVEDFGKRFNPHLDEKEAALFTPTQEYKGSIEFLDFRLTKSTEFRGIHCENGTLVSWGHGKVWFRSPKRDMSACRVGKFNDVSIAALDKNMKVESVTIAKLSNNQKIIFNGVDISGWTISFKGKDKAQKKLLDLSIENAKIFARDEDGEVIYFLEEFKWNGGEFPAGTLIIIDGESISEIQLPRAQSAKIDGMSCLFSLKFFYGEQEECVLAEDYKFDEGVTLPKYTAVAFLKRYPRTTCALPKDTVIQGKAFKKGEYVFFKDKKLVDEKNAVDLGEREHLDCGKYAYQMKELLKESSPSKKSKGE